MSDRVMSAICEAYGFKDKEKFRMTSVLLFHSSIDSLVVFPDRMWSILY